MWSRIPEKGLNVKSADQLLLECLPVLCVIDDKHLVIFCDLVLILPLKLMIMA